MTGYAVVGRYSREDLSGTGGFPARPTGSWHAGAGKRSVNYVDEGYERQPGLKDPGLAA